MRILHYSLGLPPFRTGGMTTYSTDLMTAEVQFGHIVGILWPGRIKGVAKHVSIKMRSLWKEIYNFEIINPLPVPLDEGIAQTELFMRSSGFYAYEKFLSDFQPDIIHVHTLFGLHKDFLLAAKTANVKIVFTVHDFFCICPKVTLYCKGNICPGNNYQQCVTCNNTSLSIWKMHLLQSALYRNVKELQLIKILRRYHRESFFEDGGGHLSHSNVCNNASQYNTLQKFYLSLLQEVDLVIYNSTLTKDIYSAFLKDVPTCTEYVMHKNITDRRIIKKFGQELKLLYLSASKKFKGFNILIQALDELFLSGVDRFSLHVYGLTSVSREYMVVHEAYTYDQQEEIFQEADVLVAPSVGYDSFGFTVLEGLSFGVPVITSKNTGAKDLVNQMHGGWVIDPEVQSLKQCIMNIYKNRDLLVKVNENLVGISEFPRFQSHVQSILHLYEKQLDKERG